VHDHDHGRVLHHYGDVPLDSLDASQDGQEQFPVLQASIAVAKGWPVQQ
jgi:hypothetical protein